jgi:hypothetical protein
MAADRRVLAGKRRQRAQVRLDEIRPAVHRETDVIAEHCRCPRGARYRPCATGAGRTGPRSDPPVGSTARTDTRCPSSLRARIGGIPVCHAIRRRRCTDRCTAGPSNSTHPSWRADRFLGHTCLFIEVHVVHGFVIRRRQVIAHAGVAIVLISRNSASPATPISRPMPDCL